ncbi:MAG: siderophore-interacting protein [Chloroflexota bacterium]
MTAIPLPDNLLTITGAQPLELEIAEIGDLGPHMQRVVLKGHSLETFFYVPGQDVMLVLGQSDGRALSRRYTIRSFDQHSGTLELNIVTHGPEGIGARWLANARVGDRVNGVGPRGKIFLDPDVVAHVFFGDESAAPGILNMLEALPPGRRAAAIIEVDSPSDQLTGSLGDAATVTWLHRQGTPITEAHLLEDAATGVELPPEPFHVYISGEVYRVRGVQTVLRNRGVRPDQMSPKAYWGRGNANAARGEPDERPL